jgi:60 kDa SS-A/Ro ribonucleoprotein
MNKTIFESVGSVKANPKFDTVNAAGLPAFAQTDKEALARLVLQGTFNDTFYVKGESQLDNVLELCKKVPAKFIGQLAVYARQHGYMKDTPAFLVAYLSTKDAKIFKSVFNRVINDGRMLRNFVQVIRSGKVGRKSLGTGPKKKIREWFENASDENLLNASIGNDPSLIDVIKLAHPKAKNKSQDAMFKWIMGIPTEEKNLPNVVKIYEAFKKDRESGNNKVMVPNINFQLLTNCKLTGDDWKQIAENMSFTQLRMNLNTFARNGCFSDKNFTKMVSEKLSDPGKSNVFPYQILTAVNNLTSDIPQDIHTALNKALTKSLDKVPVLKGNVYVAVDVSGSMGSPATGDRGSVTTKTRYVDVAALFASIIADQNPRNSVMLFDTTIKRNFTLYPGEVMRNANTMASFCGGGTDCSLVFHDVATKNIKCDVIVLISDNESNNGFTNAQAQWKKIKENNPNCKLVCIDIAPYVTVQTKGKDVFHVSGFSDSVFDAICAWVDGGTFVQQIESIDVGA